MKDIFNKLFGKALKGCAFAGFLALAACGVNDIYIGPEDSGGNGGNGGNGGGTQTPGEIYGSMQSYLVNGVVTDNAGNPLEGVTVTSGTSTALTNEFGGYELNTVDCVNNRFLIAFSKDGYFTLSKSAYLESQGMAINVKLQSKTGYNPDVNVTRVRSGEYSTIKAGDVEIELEGRFKDAISGESYNGTVEVGMYYLSPENEYFEESMPGSDLMAIDSEGNDAMLISYGMVDVVMTDDKGNRLQLDDNSTAQVTFNIPGSMSADAPATIPLWSFDETKGLWTYVSDAQRQPDGTYKGEVTHFSWVNLDYPEDIAWVEGYVSNDRGDFISDLTVVIDGWKKVRTNYEGYYKCLIPSNQEITVSVPSRYYANYQPEVNIKAGPVAPQTTERVDITLPYRRKIYGNISYYNGSTAEFQYSMTLNKEETDPMYTDFLGNFAYYIPNEIEGDAELTVLSAAVNKYVRQFTVEEDGDTYLEIILDFRLGDPDIVANCGGNDIYYLKVPRVTGKAMEGVIILNSSFTAATGMNYYDEDEGGNLFILTFDNYSPDQVSFEHASIMAQNNNISVMCKDAKGTVHYEYGTNAYVLNFSGKGQVLTYVNGVPVVKDATIDVNNVGILHLATMETATDYTPSSPFESFMPRLSTPAPLALLVTKSAKLGTGGSLYYNGNEDAFWELCNQANRSGIPAISEPEFYYGEGEALYYRASDNTFIEIYADLYAEPVNPGDIGDMEGDMDNPFEGLEIESPLSMTSLTGGLVSIMDFEDDPYYRSGSEAKSSIRKILRLRNKALDMASKR